MAWEELPACIDTRVGCSGDTTMSWRAIASAVLQVTSLEAETICKSEDHKGLMFPQNNLASECEKMSKKW